MKRQTLLLLTIIFCQVAFGQELKSVTKNAYGFKEEYTVLASDKKVKHGDYKRYSLKNQLTIEGKYDNNQKIGEWKFFVNGELEQTFDFSTKQLKFSKTVNEPYIIEENGTQQEKILDTPPMYLGSKVRLNEELNKVMRYPEQARRMGVEGLVAASVWITPNGEIETKIIKGILNECDNELLKGLGKIDKDWVPGTINGVPVKAQYIVVLEYKLSDTNGSVYMTVK